MILEDMIEVGEDVVPSINPLQKVEVFEEILDKNTQSMIESHYKLLPDNDSKARLFGTNFFIEDKLSGRSKMTVNSQLNVLLQNKQDLSEMNSQEVTHKCQKVTSENKGHLLQYYMCKDDGKSKTFSCQKTLYHGNTRQNPQHRRPSTVTNTIGAPRSMLMLSLK